MKKTTKKELLELIEELKQQLITEMKLSNDRLKYIEKHLTPPH